MKDNNGKPIYFDSIDNSAYILGKAQHSARRSWIYINGEYLNAIRTDIAGDPNEPWVNIAWKFVWTAKDSWLGPSQSLGSIPAVYNLTMDPFERYDMIFNGAEGEMNGLRTSPGRYAGEDNGWSAALFSTALLRLRPVHHEVSEHPALPGRRVERLDPGSAASEEPATAAGSQKHAESRSVERLNRG